MKKLSTGFMLLIALFLLFSNQGFGKSFTKEDIKKNLPKMLGANNVGREFYMTFHPCWETAAAGNDLKIYVSAGIRTKVTCEVPAKGKTFIAYTIPNDIIEFTLSPGLGQPYRKTDRDPPEKDANYPGAAVHVYSDDPIICYGVTRYMYTSDGFLALPVPALGKEYIAASWADPADEVIQWLTSYTSVVGAYDKTRVRFTFGGTSFSKSVSGLKPGESSNWTLNAGDVLLIGALGAHSELTGSKIVASKPVGVLSGNFCAYIPTNCGCCDFISEMELPTNTWGTEYHVTKIIERKKDSYIRIFAKEPKTKVFRDGVQIGYIRDAGGMEGDGWLSMRAGDAAPKPYVIGGDKPINVTQYNTGQGDDGVSSDPFQLVLTPTEQYQREIVFNTPGIRGGFGFPKNYINVCYQSTDVGTIPDDLEFAEVLNGEFAWKQMKAISPAPGDEFAIRINNKRYFSKTLQLPHDGVYKIKANSPFAAYAYGFSSYDSYGFPTSVALGDLTVRDTVPPDPRWTMLCDGTVNADKKTTVKDMPDDDASRSNLGVIYMHTDLSYNYKAFITDFMPGDDRETPWYLTVIDKTKDAQAVITFTDRAGNDTTLTINYYAVKLTIRPKVTKWGRLAKGDIVEKDFWFINESKVSAATVNYLTLKSVANKLPATGFELFDANGGAVALPTIIQPMDSVLFKIKFTASKEGTFTDSIGIGDTCVFAYKAYVEAEVGSPRINVSDWNFGDLTVGKTAYGQIIIKNEGSVDLIITDYVGPTLSVYTPQAGLTDRNISPTNPLVIPPVSGNSITFEVSFTPDAEKIYPDSIVFISNTEKSPEPVDSIAQLWGRGIRPGLIANSYDWGRKRIDRAAFPAGPYPANITATQDTCIKIINTGTEAVTVRAIETPSTDINGSAFIFDKSKFLNKSIEPKDSLIVEVSFQPKVAGEHELVFKYNNTAISQTETRLHGIGIVPQAVTADVDFGTTIVDDFDYPNQFKVRLTNKSSADWQYGDSMTVTGLADVKIFPEQFTNKNFGTEAFKYDKAALTFPKVLQQGDFIEFDAQFVARVTGNQTASVTTQSDAEAEVTSNWRGNGLRQGINVTGSTTTVCVATQSEMTIKVSNSGATDLTVDSVVFEPALPEFTWKTPAQALDFILGPNMSRDLVIVFKGNAEKAYTTTVKAYNSSRFDPIVSNTVTGTSLHFNRTTKVTDPLNSENLLIPIDRTVTRQIMLDPGPDMTAANVKELNLKINYNGDFLKVNQTDISLGSMLIGKCTIKSAKITDKAGEILLTLVANANEVINFQQGGELLNFKMGTYLPKGDLRTSPISVSMEAISGGAKTPCVDIAPSVSTITIDSTCVFNIRKVFISNTDYALATINPNPVGSKGAEIEFAVGLDGMTEIAIYDAKGTLVAKPVNQVLQIGKYSVNVPVSSLPSGTYFYTMKSGPFEQTQKMIVVK